MTRLRRLFGPIAATLLFYQASALLVPSMFWVSSTDATQLACTCSAGGDATCPMHHGAAGSKPCRMRSADDSGTVVLGSLLALGLVPAPTEAIAPTLSGTAMLVDVSTTIERILPPDPPPPRT